MDSLVVELYKHNHWANMRVLDLCEGLSDEQLDASAPGTYGSIRNTLMHIIGAQERYIARLTDQPRESTLREDQPFPGFETLRAHAVTSGETLIDLARDFDSSKILRGTWRGAPYELPAVIPMMQAINHATEHRSHISSVLSQIGIQPPDTDVWAYGDSLSGTR